VSGLAEYDPPFEPEIIECFRTGGGLQDSALKKDLRKDINRKLAAEAAR